MTRQIDRAALLMAFAVIVYNALAFGGVRVLDQAVSLALMIPILCLLAMQLVRSHDGFGIGALVGIMILGFLVFAWGRHPFADVEYSSRKELLDATMAASIFWLVVCSVNRAGDVRWVIAGFVIVGAALALYAGYQYFSRSELVWHWVRPEQYQGRGSGTFINPNHLAGFLELVIPLGIALTLDHRFSWVGRIVAGYCVLVMIVGVALTFSRGGWLATATGMAVMFAWVAASRRRAMMWVVVVAVVTAAVGGVIASTITAQQRIALSWREVEAWKKSTRFLIWSNSFAEWQRRPWLGIGAEHFQHRFHTHRDPWLQTNPVHAHNDYLEVLCEFGGTGLLLLVGPLLLLLVHAVATLIHSRRNPNSGLARDGPRLALLAGAVAAALAMAFHCAFDFQMEIRSNLLLAALIVGLVAALLKPGVIGPQAMSGRRAGWWRWPAAAATLGVAGLLAWQASVALSEGLALVRFARAPWGTISARDALFAANVVEPGNPETIMKLGEHYRQRSLLGEDDYERQAEEAVQWYRQLLPMTPASPWPAMRIGMCLDWLGRHDEARSMFEEMHMRDPNSKHCLAMMGWHFFQVGEFQKSREWINRAKSLPHAADPVTVSYDQFLRARGH